MFLTISSQFKMENELDIIELQSLVNEKIVLGENLIKRLHELEHIDGVKKVERKILQELKFLRKVRFPNLFFEL